MDEVIDGGLKEDGEWVSNACSVVPLSPFLWTEKAKCQTTITMMGDSHIRNLFTATVHGLRGVDAFVEGHSSDAKAGGVVRSYEWRWQDGVATDQALMHVNTNRNAPAPFEDCRCDEVQRCLRIAFVWAPTFAEQLAKMAWAQEWQSDLVVVEPGNSYESRVPLSSAWTAALDELLQRGCLTCRRAPSCRETTCRAAKPGILPAVSRKFRPITMGSMRWSLVGISPTLLRSGRSL